MKPVDIFAAILLVIGGLNWGLYGFFDTDLIAAVTGAGTGLSQILYAAVGFAALYQIFGLRSIQKRWNVSPAKVS